MNMTKLTFTLHHHTNSFSNNNRLNKSQKRTIESLNITIRCTTSRDTHTCRESIYIQPLNCLWVDLLFEALHGWTLSITETLPELTFPLLSCLHQLLQITNSTGGTELLFRQRNLPKREDLVTQMLLDCTHVYCAQAFLIFGWFCSIRISCTLKSP